MPDPEPRSRATARALVLYNPRGEWRYAIYNDREVLDGFLANLPAHVSAEQAQTHLLALVEEMTGQRYSATWRYDAPHWWSANLAVLD